MSQTTVRADVKGGAKTSGDFMHFRGVWWTISRQSSGDLWLIHQPDRRAVFEYSMLMEFVFDGMKMKGRVWGVCVASTRRGMPDGAVLLHDRSSQQPTNSH